MGLFDKFNTALGRIMDKQPGGKDDGGVGEAQADAGYGEAGKKAGKKKADEIRAAREGKKLPPSGEDEVGKKPLVTDDKGKEVVPEIRKKRTQAETRNKLYGSKE